MGSGTATGTWNGKFYGPGAAEFGYVFNVQGNKNLQGNVYTATGVAVGKKQ